MGLTKPIEQIFIKLSRYIYVSQRYYTRGNPIYKFKRYCQLGLADFKQPVGLKMNLEMHGDQV